MFERSLPPYLAHDLDAWKRGVAEKSRLLDFTACERLQRQYYKTYLTARYEALFGVEGRPSHMLWAES